MTAQDIMQMADEEIIGFHRHLPPFRAKRMDWRRFPLLAQRQAIPPPPLPALPPLAERSLETEAVKPTLAPLPSWRLDPALLRWGRPPLTPNGLRK